MQSFLYSVQPDDHRSCCAQTKQQIEKDIPRTFPNHPFFKQKEGMLLLRRVLTAFVNNNPSLGYTQVWDTRQYRHAVLGQLDCIVGVQSDPKTRDKHKNNAEESAIVTWPCQKI